MAWIESHQSLRNHRKTGRLARRLGVSKVTAIGHLHCLWWWCMDNAPGGYLDGIDPEDIAEGAEWEGDPCAFIDALAFAGFLDDHLEVHDWYDYAGKLIEKRAIDAARKRDARRKTDDPAPSELRNAHVSRTSTGHPEDGAGTVPNRTQPNLTQPDPSGGDIAREPLPLARPPRPAPKRADARPTLPSAGDLVEQLAGWATEKGLRDILPAEVERFRDYCLSGKDGKPVTYADYAAACRKWITNPNYSHGPRPLPRASPNGYHKPSATEGFAAIAERFKREADDGPGHLSDAIDVPFAVREAHRRQPPRGA